MEKYKFIYKKILEKNKKIYLFMTVLMMVETIFFLGNLEILTNVRNEKQAINDIQTKNLYDMELLVNGSENIEDKIKYLLDGITDGCDLISVYQSSQIASDNKNKQMNLIMITKEIASVYKPKLKSGQWITDKKYDSSHIPVVVSKEMSKKYKIGKSYILNDSMHETKNYNIVVTGVLESNYYLDLEYSPSISSDENLMIALNSNYKTDEIVYEEAMGTNIIVRCLVRVKNDSDIDSLLQNKYIIEAESLSTVLSENILHVQEVNMMNVILSISLMMLTIIWNIVFSIYIVICLKDELKVLIICGARTKEICSVFLAIKLKYMVEPALLISIVYIIANLRNMEIAIEGTGALWGSMIVLFFTEFITVFKLLQNIKNRTARLETKN